MTKNQFLQDIIVSLCANPSVVRETYNTDFVSKMVMELAESIFDKALESGRLYFNVAEGNDFVTT